MAAMTEPMTKPTSATPQIVSLLPSATEIVCALGFQHALVGRSHECDFPPGVEQLPVCTRAKLETTQPSLGIDAQVKDLLRQGLSIYEVLLDPLETLQPTHIITQDQCEVCAVSLREVEAASFKVLGARAKIVSLRAQCLAEVWQDIRQVGRALGAFVQAEQLIQRLKARLDAVAEKTRPLANKPHVACIEWLDPLMASGNWVPELVAMAGGFNLFGEAGKHSPWLDWDSLLKADPDVIIVMPCGFDEARTRQEMVPLQQDPRWRGLKAVRHGQVFVVDGNQYFNRPGPRLVESLELLAGILHPTLFPTLAGERRLIAL